jgi:cobalt/nickel transport protein
MKKKLYVLLGILVVLVPLGLLTDADAWGEWGADYYKKVLGFVPDGIVKVQSKLDFYHLLPDYSMSGTNSVIGYYVSAIVGIILIMGLYYLLYLTVKRKKS